MIKSVLPLSLIIALRFFGLFLVLPIISVYAMNLEGATPTLVGIVIGGYALTQMIFQVPFGMISDKLGRKKTIIIGLLLFAAGSLICALSSDIYSLLFGRLLQGAGAIGAVVTATISDLVKEEQRPKAMATMGMFWCCICSFNGCRANSWCIFWYSNTILYYYDYSTWFYFCFNKNGSKSSTYNSYL
jgi:MFS family permease